MLWLVGIFESIASVKSQTSVAAVAELEPWILNGAHQVVPLRADYTRACSALALGPRSRRLARASPGMDERNGGQKGR